MISHCNYAQSVVPIYPHFSEKFYTKKQRKPRRETFETFSVLVLATTVPKSYRAATSRLVPSIVAFLSVRDWFVPSACHPLEWWCSRRDSARVPSTPTRNQYVATKAPIPAETPRNFPSTDSLIMPRGSHDKQQQQPYPIMPLGIPTIPNLPEFCQPSEKKQHNSRSFWLWCFPLRHNQCIGGIPIDQRYQWPAPYILPMQ